ncbi:MAG: protease modulator HflC [Bryobacterales bacterium]|nr:protease modulator HflC [Bryobacterales bacterium]
MSKLTEDAGRALDKLRRLLGGLPAAIRALGVARSLLLVILAVVLYDCVYVIDEAQQGVLTHFGRISPPVRQPGLHVKFPWPVSKIYKVDRRVHNLRSPAQELITDDQKNVLVNGYMLWRVADPIRYVEAIRTEPNAIGRLQDLYLSGAGIVVSNKARDAFVSLGLDHEDLRVASEEIRGTIQPIAEEEYGIDVMKVGIVEYTLPVENRASVVERMIAERGRIAARYRSEGEEQAIRVEALAISEHEKIMATAHAQATQILGEAEADAMRVLGDAYRRHPEFYRFVRALDSYDTIIDKNTSLLLPADSELFRYLDSQQIPTR